VLDLVINLIDIAGNLQPHSGNSPMKAFVGSPLFGLVKLIERRSHSWVFSNYDESMTI
jgi:hypothetical protein